MSTKPIPGLAPLPGCPSLSMSMRKHGAARQDSISSEPRMDPKLGRPRNYAGPASGGNFSRPGVSRGAANERVRPPSSRPPRYATLRAEETRPSSTFEFAAIYGRKCPTFAAFYGRKWSTFAALCGRRRPASPRHWGDVRREAWP